MYQAFVGNVRTCRRDVKGKGTSETHVRPKVPRRGTGAEQPVLAVTARESEFERRGCVIQHDRGVNQQWDERHE
jgi:hypothetical protein